MKITVLCFGITREILGGFSHEIELNSGAKINDLRNFLIEKYPVFQKLSSLRIAVNEEYAEDTLELNPKDEIVLIPPVSGG
jgi:molybdopterin synthase sulfur carrier subunit